MKKSIIIILILIAGSLRAQQIITDRPDQTESSSTIPKGSLQIESGILLGFTEEGNDMSRQLLAPSNLFRFGLTKGVELRVLNQFESLKNQFTEMEISGVSDLEIGTKIQILRKEGVNTEIAFLSHVVLPTGSKGLTNDRIGTINKLSLAHQMTENSSVGYNLGYNYFGRGKGDFTYSLAFGFGVTDKVGVYAEPFGTILEFSDLEASFDTGLTYLLRDNFQLDFSFGLGLNHTMNYLSTGFSWNIHD